jgi:glutamyl-tRNA synthetase
MADKALCYFADFDEFDPKSAKTHLRPVALPLLAELRTALAETDVWTIERTQTVVESVAEMHDVKLGKLAQPLRVALTGQAASPGIGVTLALVGRERALQRIDRAIEYIGQRAGA